MPFQILLVDDDRDFREELRECLSQYRVIEAGSGEEAIAIIKKPHAIDLVLLDVVMPGMPGTQVLREIKKIAPSLSIIMLTANSSKDSAIEALKGHADDYIEKPFDMEVFFKTIQRALLNKAKPGSLAVPPGKMERVRAFLENNYDKKVGLKDVAEEVCLSPKYLSRLFKEKTGSGFNDYRLKVKIEMARKLLRTTPVTVHEISDRLGYKNIESFVRIFKKITGETPTMHRSKTRKAHGKTRHTHSA